MNDGKGISFVDKIKRLREENTELKKRLNQIATPIETPTPIPMKSSSIPIDFPRRLSIIKVRRKSSQVSLVSDTEIDNTDISGNNAMARNERSKILLERTLATFKKVKTKVLSIPKTLQKTIATIYQESMDRFENYIKDLETPFSLRMPLVSC